MLKPLIAVLRGGFSGESVISHQSAARMFGALDTDRWDRILITIDPDGWRCEDENGRDLPFDRGTFNCNGRKVDAALIAIHGSPGEDGRLQGVLDMLGIPYQTGDHINMAITFSKYSTTALLRQLGFPVPPSVLVAKAGSSRKQEIEALGLPVFVKPDRSGSSLGVTKVKQWNDLMEALDTAFQEGDLVMLEKAAMGREITCGVITLQGEVKALPVCEIRTSREFFDYEAKYHASDTEELVPAPLPAQVTAMVQQRSVAIYQAMNCRGMVRVDHFWNEDSGELVTIELNTVPGFSKASIFPKMLEASGLGVEAAVNGMVEEMIGHRL